MWVDSRVLRDKVHLDVQGRHEDPCLNHEHLLTPLIRSRSVTLVSTDAQHALELVRPEHSGLA